MMHSMMDSPLALIAVMVVAILAVGGVLFAVSMYGHRQVRDDHPRRSRLG